MSHEKPSNTGPHPDPGECECLFWALDYPIEIREDGHMEHHRHCEHHPSKGCAKHGAEFIKNDCELCGAPQCCQACCAAAEEHQMNITLDRYRARK